MKLTPQEIKNAIQEHENKIQELQEQLKKSSYVTGFEGISDENEYRFKIGQKFLVSDEIYKIRYIDEGGIDTIYEIEGAKLITEHDSETYTESELTEIILRGSFNE